MFRHLNAETTVELTWPEYPRSILVIVKALALFSF